MERIRKLKKSQKVAIIVAIALIIGLGSYSLTLMLKPPVPRVLVYAYGAEAVSIDCQDMTDNPSETICLHVYDNLVRFNEKMETVPGLAESWKVSEDRKTWTFHLRRGVKFHDGTPFDAKVVKFSFDRIRDPKLALKRRGLYIMITSVEVLDEYTVTITTEVPFGALLSHLAHPAGGIVSPKAVEKWGKDYGEHPVGTGPYKFVEWVRGERLVLERFDEYWGGRPKLDKILFKPVREDAARVMMLETGEADVVQRVPAHEVERLKAKKDIEIRIEPSNRIIYIAMNNFKKPFKDVRVRQALNYAIDKKAIVEKLLLGYAQPADSCIAKGTWGYTPTKYYEYNPALAKRLLAEAGYPDGFKATLWTPHGRYFMDKQVAEAVQSYLRAVGVEVELVVWEWAAYLAAIRKPPEEAGWEMCLIGWAPSTADADWHLRPLFHSGSWPPRLSNYAFYKNEKVDELIMRGWSTDSKVRLEAYKEAQRIIVDEAPWVFIHFEWQITGIKKELHGITVLATEHVLVRDAYFA